MTQELLNLHREIVKDREQLCKLQWAFDFIQNKPPVINDVEIVKKIAENLPEHHYIDKMDLWTMEAEKIWNQLADTK